MTTVRKMEPREKKLEAKTRSVPAPLTHGMDDFFENVLGGFPRRWMRMLEDPFMMHRPMFRNDEEWNEPLYPHIDLVDREAELFIRAELPGVKKSDLDIEILGDRLMIKAEREFKEEKKEGMFFRAEMGRGTMARTVFLPAEVDAGKAKAVLVDGILELTLPKMEVMEKRTIKVS